MNTINGWYRCTIENIRPAEDEVKFFDEWVEFKNDKPIDLCSHLKITKVLRKEITPPKPSQIKT